MQQPNLPVALTGATGFLGSHLADLLLGRGTPLVAAVRNPAKASDLASRGAEVRVADLADEGTLVEAFAGCGAVIANAAIAVGWSRVEASAFEVNVTGTENTLRAAAKAGVTRVVYVSSIAVYRTRLQIDTPEDHPQLDGERRELDLSQFTTNLDYSRSKARAERRAWALARELGLDLTVVRPGPIYGPRDGKMTDRYASWMRRPVLFAPTVSIPHGHAGDVALAIAGALDNPASSGQAYNTTGPSVGVYEFLSAWKRLAGAGPVLVPIPVPVRVAYDNRAAERDLGARWRSIEDGIQSVLDAG